MDNIKKLESFEIIFKWVKERYRTQSMKDQFEVATMIYTAFQTTDSSSILDKLEEYLKEGYEKSASHWRARDTYKITLEKLQTLKEMRCHT